MFVSVCVCVYKRNTAYVMLTAGMTTSPSATHVNGRLIDLINTQTHILRLSTDMLALSMNQTFLQVDLFPYMVYDLSTEVAVFVLGFWLTFL